MRNWPSSVKQKKNQKTPFRSSPTVQAVTIEKHDPKVLDTSRPAIGRSTRGPDGRGKSGTKPRAIQLGICMARSVQEMTLKPRAANPTCQRLSVAKNASHSSSLRPAGPCVTSPSASIARQSKMWGLGTWNTATTPAGFTTRCPARPEGRASPLALSPRLSGSWAS